MKIETFIEMFDRRGSGTIRLDEFGALWKYVQVKNTALGDG